MRRSNIVSVTLLGEGHFLFVCSIGVSITVKTVSALGGDKDITLQNVSLVPQNTDECESFKTAELVLQPQGQREGKGKGRQTTLVEMEILHGIL